MSYLFYSFLKKIKRIKILSEDEAKVKAESRDREMSQGTLAVAVYRIVHMKNNGKKFINSQNGFPFSLLLFLLFVTCFFTFC